uniref:Ig-like domain-containing protein n=1 Tax=Chelydra serpentina TaxID=8475 RepID=A0A8C3XPG0_CHESE
MGFSCSLAAVTLTQPGSARAEPGSSITLDCVVSGYNINDHHLHWVRQAPGKGLVWVTAFRTGYGTITANEFKGRVTPSTSGSTARLKLDRLTAADTATYYCARETQCSLPSFLSCSNL